MNKKQKIKNIIKKTLCFLGVVFALIFSFFTFKNSNLLLISKADNIQIGFKGSQVPICSQFYENGSPVVGFSRHTKTFDFSIVDNKVQISCWGHYTQQLIYNESSKTFSQHTDYGNFGFANVEQVVSSSQPHDNILVAGTYKWVDILQNVYSFSIDINFISSSISFHKIYSDFDLLSQSYNLKYSSSSSDYLVFDPLDRSFTDGFQTIVLSTDQQVDSSFYNWAINQGNLVFQGGSSTTDTEVKNIKSVSIAYGENQTNKLETYFYLAGSDDANIPDSNKKFYVPVTITTENLKSLNFVGVIFDNDNIDEDINDPLSKVTYYNSITYFTADNGKLKISYLSSLDNQTTSIYNREHIYYFTATSGDNYNLGYQDGYNAGNIDGKQLGYNQGFDNGRKDGYNSGYNIGYSAGVDSSHNYTFLSLISAVITAPFTAFKSLFNFDLLGVNILTLLGSLFTIAVVVTIIKKVI